MAVKIAAELEARLNKMNQPTPGMAAAADPNQKKAEQMRAVLSEHRAAAEASLHRAAGVQESRNRYTANAFQQPAAPAPTPAAAFNPTPRPPAAGATFVPGTNLYHGTGASLCLCTPCALALGSLCPMHQSDTAHPWHL
jgi:hypothetical protein